jgi:predicted phosphodiesterase
MRVLVISDIHANYTALEAVLKDAGQVDETWCLGDLVGYGPDPNAVVEEVHDIPKLTCILGNHDMAAIGKMPLEAFNGDARRSLIYHEKVITASSMDFMRSLSANIKVRGDATLAHGSPRDPLWEYILNALSARVNFEHFETPWCFVGHTHIQCMFALDEKTDRVTLDQTKAAPKDNPEPGLGRPTTRPRPTCRLCNLRYRSLHMDSAPRDIQYPRSTGTHPRGRAA